jgi:hypothetical protein
VDISIDRSVHILFFVQFVGHEIIIFYKKCIVLCSSIAAVVYHVMVKGHIPMNRIEKNDYGFFLHYVLKYDLLLDWKFNTTCPRFILAFFMF